jgi:hypothetical protein
MSRRPIASRSTHYLYTIIVLNLGGVLGAFAVMHHGFGRMPRNVQSFAYALALAEHLLIVIVALGLLARAIHCASALWRYHSRGLYFGGPAAMMEEIHFHQ